MFWILLTFLQGLSGRMLLSRERLLRVFNLCAVRVLWSAVFLLRTLFRFCFKDYHRDSFCNQSTISVRF